MPTTHPARDWFWQLAAERRGPDWHLVAAFAPADAAALAAALRRHAPAGFASVPPPAGGEQLLDAHSAARLAGHPPGAPPPNLWVYHAVELCGAELRLERGYGGYPGGPEGRAETALLLALVATPGLALTGWRVFAAGDGYPVETVAAGDSAAALLAYLAPDPASS